MLQNEKFLMETFHNFGLNILEKKTVTAAAAERNKEYLSAISNAKNISIRKPPTKNRFVIFYPGPKIHFVWHFSKYICIYVLVLHTTDMHNSTPVSMVMNGERLERKMFASLILINHFRPPFVFHHGHFKKLALGRKCKNIKCQSKVRVACMCEWAKHRI